MSIRLVLLLSVALAQMAVSASAKNVLLIVVDDLNVDLGCYGATQVITPNIDRLAGRGVRFDRAYAQYPLCNPSRSSFLSGRRPENTGIYVLPTPVRSALPDVVTLPQLFREHGYFTGGAGKIFHNPATNDRSAWDFYEDGNGSDEQEKAAIAARAGGGDNRPRWHVLDGDGWQTRDGVNTATTKRLLGERAVDQLPFFLAMGYHKPHLPWTAPRKYFHLYDAARLRVEREPEMEGVPAIALQTELSGSAQPDSRAEATRAYYACVSFIDDLIGSLLAELDRLGLSDSTSIVLFSDHGFHLGDHGGMWAKLSAFDRSTRVPLIVVGKSVPQGKVVKTPVELLDVFPTIAEIAELPLPDKLDGISLLPAARGEIHRRPTASSMVFHYDVKANRDVLGRTIVGPEWRYTEWDGGSAGREIYRRSSDPGEYRNRVDDPTMAQEISAAHAELTRLPPPKPGPANRPRALLRGPR